MGYDMKPLERRFKQAFEEAYGRPVGWPLYWEFPRPVYSSFLSNMSVGYLLDSRPDNPFPGGQTEKLESSPDFYIHENPGALPRAFTMDRVVESSEAEAMKELVEGDLRKGVFIENNKQLTVNGEPSSAPIIDYKSYTSHYKVTDPASFKHFNELQFTNPVTRLDLTNPNRIDVDIAVTKPAMLVLTEIWYPGWEAVVDGEPVELYRVNYLQRGVWLNKGEHRVELIFRPKSWRIGMNISIISWGALILVLLVWGIRRRIRHYHPTTGSGGVSI
jgi:hypothetical protein